MFYVLTTVHLLLLQPSKILSLRPFSILELNCSSLFVLYLNETAGQKSQPAHRACACVLCAQPRGTGIQAMVCHSFNHTSPQLPPTWVILLQQAEQLGIWNNCCGNHSDIQTILGPSAVASRWSPSLCLTGVATASWLPVSVWLSFQRNYTRNQEGRKFTYVRSLAECNTGKIHVFQVNQNVNQARGMHLILSGWHHR